MGIVLSYNYQLSHSVILSFVFNPLFATNQSNSGTARGGGGRGGAWGGRGRGGQGGDGRRGVGKSWLADRPVRCPNEAPPGSFCGFPNYQEAEKCGKCGVRNPYHKTLEPKSNPQPNNQRGGQGNWRGRFRFPQMNNNSLFTID